MRLNVSPTKTTNTKKVYLDRLQAATTPGAGITPKYQPVQTRVYGNTGIVTERESLTTPQGSTELITTSVWIKDQGHWKLVLRQNTLLR